MTADRTGRMSAVQMAGVEAVQLIFYAVLLQDARHDGRPRGAHVCRGGGWNRQKNAGIRCVAAAWAACGCQCTACVQHCAVSKCLFVSSPDREAALERSSTTCT